MLRQLGLNRVSGPESFEALAQAVTSANYSNSVCVCERERWPEPRGGRGPGITLNGIFGV